MPKPQPAHADVAERFRYLLEAKSLSREEFVVEVGFAITPRSLFSITSGARQPSRALAVLIEKIWGYRADFLLEGKGAMWAAPPHREGGHEKRSLSPLEQDVITFMRRSVDNARAMQRALEAARLWERLFARTEAMLKGLEACAADPEQRLLYPPFAKLVYEDCRLLADRFEQLTTLVHRRRVHRLTSRFVARYIDALPRTLLKRAQTRELEAMMGPVVAKREERLRVLDESIEALRTTLENFTSLGSPLPMLAARSSVQSAQRRRASIERLQAALAKETRLSPKAMSEMTAAIAALKAEGGALPTIWSQMKRTARDLLHELEAEVAPIPAQSLEELRALHERFVEPLMA